MLGSTVNDTIFANEVLTQFDMKDSRLTYEVMRQALVRFKELAENHHDNIECPHCGEDI